jgi:hypothetical protein
MAATHVNIDGSSFEGGGLLPPGTFRLIQGPLKGSCVWEQFTDSAPQKMGRSSMASGLSCWTQCLPMIPMNPWSVRRVYLESNSSPSNYCEL